MAVTYRSARVPPLRPRTFRCSVTGPIGPATARFPGTWPG